MSAPSTFAWPSAQAAQAVNELGRRAGLIDAGGELPSPPIPDQRSALRWLEEVGSTPGNAVELESVDFAYDELERGLRAAAPALVPYEHDGQTFFLALLGHRRRDLRVLGPDLREHHVPLATVGRAMKVELERRYAGHVETALEGVGVASRRRERVLTALRHEALRGRRVGGCWLLRCSAGSPFRRQLRRAKLPQLLLRMVAWHLAYSLVFLASWWLIGRGALAGQTELGWLAAWFLALFTLVPLRVLGGWTQARLGIHLGALLRRRLLAGALKLDPDEVRHEGAGIHLGRALESQAVEQLALSGGFLAVLASIELALAGWVLGAGPGGGLRVALLVGWVLLTAAIGWSAYRRRTRWTRARLDTTHALVETMIGHRTRVVQGAGEQLHEDEDRALARDLRLARDMDASLVWIRALVQRGWNVLAVLALFPVLLGERISTPQLAVTMGGILFASQAFAKLGSSIAQLTTAIVAWRRIRHLFRAAARTEPGNPSARVLAREPASSNAGSVLEARGVHYRYRGRVADALTDCSLRVGVGERVLLQGASGSGKSTLGALLLGLREPTAGLLLQRGLDLATLGPRGWRRRIGGIPQFHENLVLNESFLFNLLFGRAWPPARADVEAAQRVCAELGLDDLLARMPGGLTQVVGETGWQLSHGERSRLFLARALLGSDDLLILDESFAALDPVNLRKAMQCVMKRDSALVVIAHP